MPSLRAAEPGAATHRATAALAGPASVQLADTTVELDVGGVHQIGWPGAAALMQQLGAWAARAAPVVRFAGGALIADLSLHDNLLLESSLRGAAAPAGPPADLLAGVERLFAAAGCPLQRGSWHAVYPHQAGERDRLQVRVGRALLADPDVLVVDAEAWDEALLTRARFSQAFVDQHPWRALVWAHTRPPRPGGEPDPETAP